MGLPGILYRLIPLHQGDAADPELIHWLKDRMDEIIGVGPWVMVGGDGGDCGGGSGGYWAVLLLAAAAGGESAGCVAVMGGGGGLGRRVVG